MPQLIADPLYILKSNSKGNEHRFVVVTSSRGNIPMQKLSVFLNPKNSVAVVSAYDEKIDISKEKKAGRVIYDKKKELSKTILTSKARAIDNSNNIMNDNSNNFNPDVNKHEGADNPNIYFQENSNKSFENLTENEKDNIFAEEFIDNEQIKNDEQTLSEDVENHLKKQLGRRKIRFGLAPKILQEFGVPELPMNMAQHKYDCSTNRLVVDGDIHNISDDVMKKIPELLSNPLMIAEPTEDSNYKGNNRYVVTVDEVDNDGNLINVIIDYDWQGKRVNIIPTAYGKDNFNNYVQKVFNEADKLNKTIYINKKNLMSHISKVQFPRGNSKGSNDNITYKDDLIKSAIKKHEKNKNTPKRFFQEIEDKSEEVNLIAGYNAQELMDKYTGIIDKIGELSEQDPAMSMLLAKQHVLEEAFEAIAKGVEKIDAKKFNDLATDVYYVMNDQDLPQELVEVDKSSKKTFNELAKMHKERLEEQERNYRGYFEEGNEKSIITIMSNADASTALHALGHFYLMGLNRLAEKGEKAKKLLDAAVKLSSKKNLKNVYTNA